MNDIIYEDTEAGVLLALANMSDLNLTDATADCDLWVEGVWLVTTPNDPTTSCAVVWLAGFTTAAGNRRPFNDFECEERT